LTRKVIGILIGVLIALALGGFLKSVSDYIFAPAGLDPSDPVQAGQIMAQMPLPGLIMVLASQFGSALFGGFVGARIAHARWAAWSTTGLAAAVTLLLEILSHYPIWLIVATLTAFGAAAWLAGVWAGDPEPDEADAAPEPAARPAPWSAAPEPAYEPDAPEPAWSEPAYEPEPIAEPEPVITRPRYASFEELRAAAPTITPPTAPPEPAPEPAPSPDEDEARGD